MYFFTNFTVRIIDVASSVSAPMPSLTILTVNLIEDKIYLGYKTMRTGFCILRDFSSSILSERVLTNCHNPYAP